MSGRGGSLLGGKRRDAILLCSLPDGPGDYISEKFRRARRNRPDPGYSLQTHFASRSGRAGHPSGGRDTAHRRPGPAGPVECPRRHGGRR